MSEQTERAKELGNLRKQIPAPVNCTDAASKLNQLQAMDTALDNNVPPADLFGKLRFAAEKPRLKYAISVLLTEYGDWYNSNQCAVVTGAVVMPGSTPISGDHVLTSAVVPQSGVPAGTTPPTGTGANTAGTGVTDIVKKVPTWVWYAGGGLLALILLVVALKHKPKAS